MKNKLFLLSLMTAFASLTPADAMELKVAVQNIAGILEKSLIVPGVNIFSDAPQDKSLRKKSITSHANIHTIIVPLSGAKSIPEPKIWDYFTGPKSYSTHTTDGTYPRSQALSSVFSFLGQHQLSARHQFVIVNDKKLMGYDLCAHYLLTLFPDLKTIAVILPDDTIPEEPKKPLAYYHAPSAEWATYSELKNWGITFEIFTKGAGEILL